MKPDQRDRRLKEAVEIGHRAGVAAGRKQAADEIRDQLDMERARVAEIQGAIHRLHYPDGDPATEGNVWCACDKLWPCDTVTAVSVASQLPAAAEVKS